MADVFSRADTLKLLHNKFVLLLGDSNMRGMYKDFVMLVNQNRLLSIHNLKTKGEESFEGDRRMKFSGLIKARGYREDRLYQKNGVKFEYKFITKCWTDEIEQLLASYKRRAVPIPDVIIMNSCLWDVTRYAHDGVDVYKSNMKKLMVALNESLPKSTLFIWTTTLPVSSTLPLRGGLLVKQIYFLQQFIRFEIMEANMYCRQLIAMHGYDVLDLHHYLRMQIHRRQPDGIHFSPLPVRLMINLLLTHISLSWNVPLPGNFEGLSVARMRKMEIDISEREDEAYVAEKLKELEKIASLMQERGLGLSSEEVEDIQQTHDPRPVKAKNDKRNKDRFWRMAENRAHIPVWENQARGNNANDTEFWNDDYAVNNNGNGLRNSWGVNGGGSGFNVYDHYERGDNPWQGNNGGDMYNDAYGRGYDPRAERRVTVNYNRLQSRSRPY